MAGNEQSLAVVGKCGQVARNGQSWLAWARQVGGNRKIHHGYREQDRTRRTQAVFWGMDAFLFKKLLHTCNHFYSPDHRALTFAFLHLFSLCDAPNIVKVVVRILLRSFRHMINHRYGQRKPPMKTTTGHRTPAALKELLPNDNASLVWQRRYSFQKSDLLSDAESKLTLKNTL